MKEYKRLKDPIYGYVNIPIQYMTDIIDTSYFQRLRRIIQTSYSPLYSSAVHNRFVHSIGVFHLGEIASAQLVKEIKQKFSLKQPEKWERIFLLACLLHDVGHAPFSHTGEVFYLDKITGYDKLHETLQQYVADDEFSKDIPKKKSAAAAPHEIMSAIIGLKEFAGFFQYPYERSFFARCITGYEYQSAALEDNIKNCFISLLNSKIIDVDKLDYLIRDAYITGFDTVNIDYERLLTSLTVISINDSYELAYYKSAISVIENVIYAHDSERKWIQSHPIVLYESYLLQHIITYLCNQMEYNGSQLFSLESLGKSGQLFQNDIRIRLMCDDDIIYLMKNVYPNQMSEEYFERKLRRHPIWKSEAEYKAFFIGEFGGGRVLTSFEDAMDATALYLTKSTDSWVIDEQLISKIKQELSLLDQLELDEATRKVQKKTKELILKVINCLKSYALQKKIECSFVLLKASQFNSGFGKPNFSQTNIVFSSADGDFPAKVDIISSLEAKEREREKFYYLFYKRSEGNIVELDNLELCKRLMKEFI